MRTTFAFLLTICTIFTYAQERVGINTTNPQFTLDIRPTSPDLGADLQLGNMDANHFLRLFPGHNQEPKPFIYFSDSDTFRIANGASNFGGFTERLTIQPEGNVGMGISNPMNRLHLHDPEVFMTDPPFVFTFGNPNYLQITNGVSGTTSIDGLLLGLDEGAKGHIQHSTQLDISAGSAEIALNAAAKTISIDSNLTVLGNVNIQSLAGQGERRLIVNSNGDISAGQLIQGSSGNTVRDIDGNEYATIIIGTQEWMAENLRTTKFNDGSDIPHAPIPLVWEKTDNGQYPAYCWYDNSVDYKYPYGALYNWYAIDNTSNNNRNVCPTEWHVPSSSEWTTLLNFLGGSSMAGGALKSTGTVTTDGLWDDPNTGATNSSGFRAHPAGVRSVFGPSDFSDLGILVIFWTTTEVSSLLSDAFAIETNLASTQSGGAPRTDGYSIRCVKD